MKDNENSKIKLIKSQSLTTLIMVGICILINFKRKTK